MTAAVEWVQAFLIELERIIPNRGTRHMLSTTTRGELEIRIGCGDWYRIVEAIIIVEDPVEAARQVAMAPRRD